MALRRVSIDPITRLEGHGKIEIFLNDKGDVENAYFQIPELRGFEQFCVGRPVEEIPRITPRICGVCPEAHHMAGAKTLDGVFKVDPPRAGHMLRELLYSAFYVSDHLLHFYILAGPDYIMGPDAPVAQRNILGVIGKVGLEIGGKVIGARKAVNSVVQKLGGKYVHPVSCIAGGISKGITEDDRKEIEEITDNTIEFGEFSLQLFEDVVLKNEAYVKLITSDGYTHYTNYMGMVDANNKVNFYDGDIRVVDPDGKQIVKFKPEDYLDHIAERVVPWSYLKIPYLKDIGWKGLVDGKDSGIYRVAPLARLNASDGMATPRAQQAHDKMYEVLGGKPVHHTLATHWARLIELLYAAERMKELITDPEITSDNFRTIPTQIPHEGIGFVEAPRGTLSHHYVTDDKGIVQKVNLIVATVHNYGPIAMSCKKAAQAVIHVNGAEVSEPLLNMVEMAFRAYDPCFGCATHTLPGQMPLEINIRDKDGNVIANGGRNIG
jgi:F420-non-reducing hydrogenase large subunit